MCDSANSNVHPTACSCTKVWRNRTPFDFDDNSDDDDFDDGGGDGTEDNDIVVEEGVLGPSLVVERMPGEPGRSKK